tara:strand:- start:761 stop:1834 length:1074 start_codon:yes stop_codon:yes gene_type:complete
LLRRASLLLVILFVSSCVIGDPLSEGESEHDPIAPTEAHESSRVDRCTNSYGVLTELPQLLSQTGLYADIQNKEVHDALWAFVPEFQLWSDTADKQRWIYVPECDPIDTSNMDDWSFPVGTRFFKEFSVNGQRIETRLILRTGEGAYDFLYGTYEWNDDESEASLAPSEGVLEAKGTSHDIPSEAQCRRCHGSHPDRGGRPSRALGFSALQLNHDGAGIRLDDLVAQGRLSHAPEGALTFPGNDVERQALGHLHVNCGVCHNATRDGVPQTDMNLWVNVNQTTVEGTSTYLTAVGKANEIFNDQNVSARIQPGQPDVSSIIYRMSHRGNNAQMPPLATKEVDETGVEAVKAWILSLP